MIEQALAIKAAQVPSDAASADDEYVGLHIVNCASDYGNWDLGVKNGTGVPGIGIRAKSN